MSEETDQPPLRPAGLRTWVLRPILWFAVASMVVTILHELAHTVVAFALGVRSTLFSYFSDLDLTPEQASTHIPALIAIAGPLFCLAIGISTWLAYRRAQNSRAGLSLLFLTVFGIATFWGNLMSAAFVGDFSRASDMFGLPMNVRHFIAAVGAISVATVHFWAGRELIQFAPREVGRIVGMLGLIACPTVLGTAAVILVNQPMPRAFVIARVTEGLFWVIAAVGALVTRERSRRSIRTLDMGWADAVVAFSVVVIVRLMVIGISFSP